MERLEIPKVVTEPSFDRCTDFDHKAWDNKHKCQCCGQKTYYKKIDGGWICSACYKKRIYVDKQLY